MSHPVPLGYRVYGRPATHRLYPAAAGARLAAWRARRHWRDPERREHAREQMTFLAGRLPGADIDALAQAYLFEMHNREEISWRPWLSTRIPVERIDVLRAAAARSGVILSFAHHGHYAGVFASIARRGVALEVAMDPWFLTQRSPWVDGVRGRRHLATVSACGVRPFVPSYAALRERLLAGRVVGLASDMPGNTAVTFLGRRVGLPSGAARLAIETGAPVVHVSARRDGHFQRLVVQDPLSPEGYDDHRDLLQEIMRRHEPAVRAWPQAFERPLRHFRPVSDDDIAEFGEDPYGRFFKRAYV